MSAAEEAWTQTATTIITMENLKLCAAESELNPFALNCNRLPRIPLFTSSPNSPAPPLHPLCSAVNKTKIIL